MAKLSPHLQGLPIAGYVPGVREVTSTELHGSPAQQLAPVEKKGRRALAVTRYHKPVAFVLSAQLTDELVRKASEHDALSEAFAVALPYLRAAVDAGTPPADALEALLARGADGGLALDLAGLAALMSRTPVRMSLDESGAPIARGRLAAVASPGGGADEDDYAAFANEA
jgi:hypothetical protein